jgi:4-hydroxyphenylpyruvate dioxygenase
MDHRLRRCLSTVSLDGPLFDKLEATALARFDAVEVMERDLTASNRPPREVRELAEGLGLAVESYQPLRDVEGVSDECCLRNRSRSARMLDTAAELGARMIVVCSNASDAAIDDPERSAAQLAELADEAAERGLDVGFEALSWGTHTRTWQRAWAIVRRASRPNLGLVVDSFHLCALGEDPARLETVPGDRISLVHMADAPLMSCDLLSWSRRFRCLPGEGAFDLAAVLQHILETDYRGAVSLEIYSERVEPRDPRQAARRAMDSLLALERGAAESRPQPPRLQTFT